MDKENSNYAERQASRAREMLQRLDVDTIKLTYLEDGRVFEAVKQACRACPDARECIHWLDAMPPKTDAPAFCPNAAVYADCKRR